MVQPSAAATAATARSVNAEMVSNGFTPSGRGTIDPSQTTRPSWTVSPVRSGEHAAPVVHHAVLRPVGHDATAERVHGDQAVAQQSGPQRIVQIGAAVDRRGLAHHLVGELVVPAGADVGPLHPHAVTLEDESSLGVVVAHDQQRLQVLGEAPSAAGEGAAQP